ncbi:hypothetical protein ACQ0P8_06525 [Halodesulfovibrio aestuarii]|uniref:Uncharacterized protein n=1 Tax=Halodesulfovibrio aestuarii TaxID=126333 RepID=A0A8G2CCA8_9BACT|nr:hypothetical protein [Halodesulfovibrio aestuarii]SHJ76244.1 hypothetical protein SAMN05660830_03166 [Halodesulfovibrio aestuarii]
MCTDTLTAIKPEYSQEEVASIIENMTRKKISSNWLVDVITSSNFLDVFKEVAKTIRAKIVVDAKNKTQTIGALQAFSLDFIDLYKVAIPCLDSDESRMKALEDVKDSVLQFAEMIRVIEQEQGKKFSLTDMVLVGVAGAAVGGASVVFGSMLKDAVANFFKKKDVA